MIMPGHFGRLWRRPTMIAAVAAATPSAAGFSVGSAAASAATLGTMAPGSGPERVRPRNSFIWLAKMMTAMPAVKPTVTGWGMNLI